MVSGESDIQQKIFYVLYSHRIPTSNVYVEVGEVDGNPEGQCNGRFLQENVSISEVSPQVNSFLSAADADSNGFCLVPITVHSDTEGNILISDINIVYNCSKSKDLSGSVNAVLSSGNGGNDGCELIPLTVHSDSPGIVRISDVRLIYSPTACERADLDGLGSVDMNDLQLQVTDYLDNGNYLLGDINGDLFVDLRDFVLLADQWLNDCICD